MKFFDKLKRKDFDNAENTKPSKKDKKNKAKEPVAVKANDSYVRTKTIYNSRYNFIVLVNYTEDFFFDMIEFLSAAIKASAHGNAGAMVTAIATGFIDENPEANNPDSDETVTFTSTFENHTEVIRHNLYYTLIGGSPDQFAKIYEVIDTYNNPILQAIQDDIYEHCSSTYFNQLIEDGILDLGKFAHQAIAGDYSTPLEYDAPYRDCLCDDDRVMLKNIPDVFAGADLLDFIKFYSKSNNGEFYCTASTLLKHHDGLDYQLFESSSNTFNRLLGENYHENLGKYTSPVYLRADDEEPVTGEVPISQLNEVFQQSYEKFTGLADNMYEYMDIDEVIENDAKEP